MTPPADFEERAIQESFLFPCVGVMTIQAAHPVHQRPVNPVFTESFVEHIPVTRFAEIAAMLFGFKGAGNIGF